jgi:hypothetical protein
MITPRIIGRDHREKIQITHGCRPADKLIAEKADQMRVFAQALGISAVDDPVIA